MRHKSVLVDYLDFILPEKLCGWALLERECSTHHRHWHSSLAPGRAKSFKTEQYHQIHHMACKQSFLLTTVVLTEVWFLYMINSKWNTGVFTHSMTNIFDLHFVRRHVLVSFSEEELSARLFSWFRPFCACIQRGQESRPYQHPSQKGLWYIRSLYLFQKQTWRITERQRTKP